MGAGVNTLFMNSTVNYANIIAQVCDNVKVISKISDWGCSNGTKLYNCFFSFYLMVYLDMLENQPS